MRQSKQVRVFRTTVGDRSKTASAPTLGSVLPVERSGEVSGVRPGGRVRARARAAWRRLVTTSAAVVLTLAAGSTVASAATLEASAPAPEQVGDLWVSAAGRRRVRGGRMDGASVHDPWVAAARDGDLDARVALAAFERATFPDHAVVLRAPKPWMEDLARPTLPVRWTRRVVEYLTYFRDNPKGRALMRGWLRRAGRYETQLRAILHDAGVPEDLVFVALAESGFNPTVRSRVGAAGLWQFMEATGKVYGLNRDYWVDERHDIVKSTHAAALYLKDLHTRFGTWELALAAFNAGYGLVMVSIDRHNTNDFWTLADTESGLPYATTNYVPKILAAAVVGTNRDALGYDAATITPLPAAEWVEVRVPAKTSLASLAKKIGQDEGLIAELNAQYIRGRTPPRGSATVRIPRAAKAKFEAAASTLHDEAVAMREHVVRHGERLTAIAARVGTTDKALRRLNGVRDSAELVGGTTIVLPPADALPKPTATRSSSDKTEHPLLAATPPVTVPNGLRRVFFRTNRASLPRDVARAFGVPWSQLVAWNALDERARLQSGQVLQVLVSGDFDPGPRHLVVFEVGDVTAVVRGSREHLEQGLLRRGLARRAYKARKGDTLTKIARRFDLTVGDLARINGFRRSHDPSVGELLVVYIPTNKRGSTLRAPDPVSRDPMALPTDDDNAKASTAATATVPQARVPKTTTTKKTGKGSTRKPSTADTATVPRRDGEGSR